MNITAKTTVLEGKRQLFDAIVRHFHTLRPDFDPAKVTASDREILVNGGEQFVNLIKAKIRYAMAA
jgi:hypothetical protein